MLDVPLALHVGFQHHSRELRREVRLLSLAHAADYPLAKSLSDLFTALDRQLRDGIGVEQIEAALAQGLDPPTWSCTCRAACGHPRAGSSGCSTWPTSSAGRSGCCHWPAPPSNAVPGLVPGQFVRQAGGDAPRSWTEARANGHANGHANVAT